MQNSQDSLEGNILCIELCIVSIVNITISQLGIRIIFFVQKVSAMHKTYRKTMQKLFGLKLTFTLSIESTKKSLFILAQLTFISEFFLYGGKYFIGYTLYIQQSIMQVYKSASEKYCPNKYISNTFITNCNYSSAR